MENLNSIAAKANEILNERIFEVLDGGIVNSINRVEGNDINMREEEGKYVLTMTGVTEVYSTPEEAIQGLIDMYVPE